MTTIDAPLGQRNFTDETGVGGRIKVRPEDFIVEEIPLYEPSGEGEHLYLRIEKRSVAHGELMSRLRRTFGVSHTDIGYAGMKDKHAVTRQTVSIHLREDPPSIDIDHERINVLWAARHRNKIKRGHLRGNRFGIRIRDVDPLRVVSAQRTLRQLERTGVPSYYGPQRFGYRRNNHLMGVYLLRGEWSAALDELLGSRGSAFPEYQRERREAYDAGRYETLPEMWSTADRAELIASKALRGGATPHEAIRVIGGTTLDFFVSSTASAMFNRILDQRIDAGTVDQLALGDVAWKHDSRAAFLVTGSEIESGELPGRLERFEISPSGPLWGRGVLRAEGAVDELERAAVTEMGLDVDTITGSRNRPVGSRRAFRVPIENTEIEGGHDEEGTFIRVMFDLPRGMFATVVLQELMKNGPVDASQRGS